MSKRTNQPKKKKRARKHGFLAMKQKDDFLGTGKASAEKIGNFIPKNRRLKSN